MLALGFGLIAACAWAVHDLLVRKLGQHNALLPMMVVVLAAGTLGLLGPVAFLADWSEMTRPAFGLATMAGLAYVLGMGGLYRAFSLAPVRLVAPILGAFPMISLGFAALTGKAVSCLEILAVLAIVGGIAVVALTGRERDAIAQPGKAIVWSLAGTVGFATTFWFAQEAARQGDELAGIMVTRVVALAAVLVIALALRAPLRDLGGAGKTLVLMGLLDALAISLVTMAARLPNPEYAAIASSLFGVLTILLAWRVLKEQVLALQWVGIATVFTGIAVLSSQG
jgi:drug/metabolite transporter (DMT)-like permease